MVFVHPVGIEVCGRKRALHAGLWLAARGRAMLACMLAWLMTHGWWSMHHAAMASVGPGAQGQ